MIHLDTNYLIHALSPGSPEQVQLDAWLAARESISISTITWAEFLCGLGSASAAGVTSAAVRALFPKPEPFLPEDAELAARLYNLSGRRRKLFADCMVAATAIRRGAALATLNVADFRRFVQHGLRLA